MTSFTGVLGSTVPSTAVETPTPTAAAAAPQGRAQPYVASAHGIGRSGEVDHQSLPLVAKGAQPAGATIGFTRLRAWKPGAARACADLTQAPPAHRVGERALEAFARERARAEGVPTTPDAPVLRLVRPRAENDEEIIAATRSKLLSKGGVGLILGLALRDIEPEDIFVGYSREYDALIIKNEAMGIIGRLASFESGAALNFDGQVIVPEGLVEKAHTGDRDALLVLTHEHRHADYRALHGAYRSERGEKEGIDQWMVDELYAHFAAYSDVMGDDMSAEAVARYGQRVYNALMRDYIDGVGSALPEHDRAELKTKVIAATFFIQRAFEVGAQERALAWLCGSARLDDVFAAAGVEATQMLVENVYKQLPMGLPAPVAVCDLEESFEVYKGFKAAVTA